MSTLIITSKNMEQIVLDTFNECILSENDGIENATTVEGLNKTFRFDSELLKSKKDIISSMLSKFPNLFRSEKGWSFLCFGNTESEGPWSGYYPNFEKLMVMAMALKLMEYTTDRSIWPTHPGGKPYIRICC